MDEETQLVPMPDSRTPEEAAETALAPVAPAPLAPTELGMNVIRALEVIAALIPDLRTPHPATAKRVRGARTVPREAVLSIIAAVEDIPRLQRLSRMDLDGAHEVIASMDDLRAISEHVTRFLAQVNYTLEARWSEVVRQAMSAYRFANILADDPNDPEAARIAAHVSTIRRHMGRRNGATGKRKKKAADSE